MNFQRKISQWIDELVNAGVEDDAELQVRYTLHALNRFCIYTIVLAALWYLLFIWAALTSAALFIHLVHLLFGLVIFLNYKRKYIAAKVMLIFATNISVLGITYLLGYQAGFYLYLYTSPLFVFWLFDIRKERLYIGISSLLYFLCYIATVVMKQSVPSYVFLNFDIHGITMYDLNLLFSIVLMFLLFNNYTRYYVLLGEQIASKQVFLQKEIVRRTESERALQKLYHELSKSYKSLEQFSFIVSHNMKAPFANIKGLLGLYEPDGENKKDNNVIIENIQQSVDNLDGILKDLSYLLTLKKDLLQEKTDVPIGDLVKDIKRSLLYEIQTAEACITETYADQLSIFTVRSVLHSILFNLIHNAIKYRNKDVPLKVEIIAFESEGVVHLEIADNGMGIDLVRYKDRIFNLYGRFHHKIEGKGVGLYLAKTQTELLGGSIAVESEVGKGTRFIIVL